MRRVKVVEVQSYVWRLERFAARCGAPVVRSGLIAGVLGQAEERRIVLRTGLRLEQQLLTLVHELTHRIIHCNAHPRINRTVCEYEAEAVERWVGAVLKVGPPGDDTVDVDFTDDLLSCSVARVRRASNIILQIAQDGKLSPTAPSLQSQAAVEIDAAAGKEFVLDDELHGMRNLIGLAQAL